jgi:tetratricopeptide (TPR) repeat protein
MLRDALALWRGEPLHGLPGDWAERTRQTWHQRRLATLAEWANAEVASGNPDVPVDVLMVALGENPLLEPVAAALMRALAGCGRGAQALEVYGSIRRRLTDDLGVDPGPELQEVHRSILRGQVSTPRPAPTPAVPAQLPADLAGFVGRHAQLAALDAMPAAAVIISGPAGVGKTALAVRWARRNRQRFPDGQLYVDLRGHSEVPPLRPIEALARLLYGLGVPVERVPVDVDDASALFRTLMADRGVLVLLDNARDAGQVRPLLPGSGASVVLVTSRDQLSGLVARDGAHRLAVELLTPEESLALLAGAISVDRVDAERTAVAELADLCSHLPLALRIAAANLAGRPRTPIARYVAELRASSQLSGLEIAGDPQASVRQAFDLSYQTQPDSARTIFRLLSLVPGPDFDIAAVTVMAAMSAPAVRDELSRLVHSHLVTDQDTGRYTQHDLLRAFGRERSDEEDTEAERSAAVGRLLNHYLGRSVGAAALAYPQVLRLPPQVEPVPFTDASAAVAWLDTERANLVAAIQSAAAVGPHEMAWLLADALRGYFASRRHAVDWLATADAALAAAQTARNPLGLAAAELTLGIAWRSLSRYPAATDHLTAALTHSQQAGWHEGEVSALGGLATVYGETGHLSRARDMFDHTLTLSDRLGLAANHAMHLGNRGVVRLWLGDLADAVADFTAALDRHRTSGSRTGQALMLTNLGWTYHYLGRQEPAEESLHAGLALQREMGDRYGEILACAGLAELYAVTGRTDEALAWAATAHELAVTTGDHGAQTLTLIANANTYRAAGQPHQAAHHGAQALHHAGEAQHRGLLTEAHLAVAHAHLDLGQDGPASHHAEHALTIARQDNYQILEATALTLLADIQSRRGQHATAIHLAERALTKHRLTGHHRGETHTVTLLNAIRHLD